jgi:hypothetical protein
MPDEKAPAPQDTPDDPASGPEEGTPAEPEEGSTQATEETTDWQERYANLQPEYTRATQEAAQYRQIIDLARQGDPQALQILGFEDAEEKDEPDEEFPDPDQRLDRIESLLVQRAEEEQQRAEEEQMLEEVDDHLATQLHELESKHGKLDDDDAEYLLQVAYLYPDADGFPDLAAAYEHDASRLEAKRQGWVDTKRTPQVQSGASASSQPDLDDDEQRREYMARRMAEEHFA